MVIRLPWKQKRLLKNLLWDLADRDFPSCKFAACDIPRPRLCLPWLYQAESLPGWYFTSINTRWYILHKLRLCQLRLCQLRRRICGSFFLSFSRSQVVNFLKWKHYHILLKWWFLHPIPFFEQKRCLWLLFHDDLRAGEQELEKKVTTNSTP